MKTLLKRSLSWFALGSLLLVLAGLAQVPEVWAAWLP